jgi:hypothetical protein
MVSGVIIVPEVSHAGSYVCTLSIGSNHSISSADNGSRLEYSIASIGTYKIPYSITWLRAKAIAEVDTRRHQVAITHDGTASSWATWIGASTFKGVATINGGATCT